MKSDTSIGKLPAEWQVRPLGELLTLAQYGLSVRGNDQGSYPILRMTNQVAGRIVARDLQFADIGSTDLVKFRVESGDLLFNRTNSFDLVGRTAIFELKGDFVFASYLIRLRTSAKQLNPHFLNFYLNGDETQSRLKSIATRAVSQSNISATRLKAFPVPVPPLDEQCQIARVLSAIQRALERQERLIALTTELKKSLMHKLFTEGTRAEPLKQTEIGLAPQSWSEVKLHEIVNLKNGYAFSSKDYVASSNTLNVRMSNIRPGGEFDLDHSPKFLPDSYATSHSEFLLRDGDLIIAMTDMANDPKILGVPTIVRHARGRNLLLNQRVGKLVPTHIREVDSEFLRFALSRRETQRFLISRAKKGVQVNIGKTDILATPILYPPIKDQQIIASALGLHDEKLGIHCREHAALSRLFRTLLHELMTARLRIHDLDLSELDELTATAAGGK